MINSGKEFYSVNEEVADAFRDGKPIVALESTVITHGLPFPQNIQLAADLEDEIREQGSIPATIAILGGKICIGLDATQKEALVHSDEVIKISSRDIAAAVVGKKSGGTTVAGTLAIAESVGLRVFATGGIGGVHRQAPFDISADLMQLAKSPLIVVCAGAKAILDIPATLEVLETYGVPVVGYKTDHFPAFYSVDSGLGVNRRVDSPEEAANLAKIHWEFGMRSGILLAAPPPAEVAMRIEVIEEAVQKALHEAQDEEVRGQAVTPFLLKRVSEITGGESLKANLGLLKNNARIAAEIAPYLAEPSSNN